MLEVYGSSLRRKKLLLIPMLLILGEHAKIVKFKLSFHVIDFR